jgi:hypothetical protein
VTQSEEPVVLGRMRVMVLGLLALGLIGTAAELLLIGHYEDGLQWSPLVVIGVGLVSLVHRAASRGRGVRTFRAAMVALIVSGVVGAALHHRGNREFQLELDPSLRGIDLFFKVLRAKTPPALAPGSLVLFGLLGLASTYKQSVAAPPPPSPIPSIPERGA